MFSNKIVEVHQTLCTYCSKSFFELKDSELDFCPNCKNELDEDTAKLQKTVFIRIQIDPITGEIKSEVVQLGNS